MPRTVQIPETLLRDLVRYHWADDRDPELVSRIREGLAAKVEAMARREEFRKPR